MKKTWAILLAAGQGSRLQAAGLPCPKQFLEWQGLPLFWHSAKTLSGLSALQGIVFVFPQDADSGGTLPVYSEMARTLDDRLPLGVVWKIAAGGARRQDSVAAGLAALPPEATHVLVHDAARPFASPPLVFAVYEALDAHAAVVPGIALADTVKRVTPEGLVAETPDRASLRAVQTPQGFRLDILRQAHAAAHADRCTGTDDAFLVERIGIPVFIVPGDPGNAKITSPADLALLERHENGSSHTPYSLPCSRGEKPMPTGNPLPQQCVPCTGFGYDVHRYGGSRPFILGGVPIATDIRIEAHSDGDTLLHALIDAILGCLGAGDIGTLFPDADKSYEGISSGILLSEVLDMADRANLCISHADLTIVAQVPKIAPHREAIAKNVAKLLRLPPSRVGCKATTEEHLGFTGEKKGIKAIAVVTATRSA